MKPKFNIEGIVLKIAGSQAMSSSESVNGKEVLIQGWIGGQ